MNSLQAAKRWRASTCAARGGPSPAHYKLGELGHSLTRAARQTITRWRTGIRASLRPGQTLGLCEACRSGRARRPAPAGGPDNRGTTHRIWATSPPAPEPVAGTAEGHWPRDRRRPLVGGPVPPVRQPQAGGRLRRSGADAMAERLDRSRAGCVQSGQPAAADNNGRAGLAVAAEPAGLGAQPVVHERVRRLGGRMRKTTIVALARKLLVALWRYTTAGVVIEGAVMKAATI